MNYKYMTPKQMRSYFEQGLFKETLVGKNKFRIVTKDNRKHDRLYILGRIIDFATSDNIKEIQEGIYGAIDELIEDDNLSAVMRLSWSLLLDLEGKYESTKKFTQLFDYDPEFLAKKLYKYLIKKSDVFAKNEEKRNLLLLICSKLPQLAEKLGFGEIEVIMDENELYMTDIKTKPKDKRQFNN